MKKFSLPFINGGKDFDMPNWTVAKHKAALEKLLQNTPGITQEERDEEFKYYVIVESLKEVDSSVTVDIVKAELPHPEDLIALFQETYNAGRVGIYAKSFRQGKPPSKEKSTGKKSTKNS